MSSASSNSNTDVTITPEEVVVKTPQEESLAIVTPKLALFATKGEYGGYLLKARDSPIDLRLLPKLIKEPTTLAWIVTLKESKEVEEPPEELKKALDSLPEDVKKTFEKGYINIDKYVYSQVVPVIIKLREKAFAVLDFEPSTKPFNVEAKVISYCVDYHGRSWSGKEAEEKYKKLKARYGDNPIIANNLVVWRWSEGYRRSAGRLCIRIPVEVPPVLVPTEYKIVEEEVVEEAPETATAEVEKPAPKQTPPANLVELHLLMFKLPTKHHAKKIAEITGVGNVDVLAKKLENIRRSAYDIINEIAVNVPSLGLWIVPSSRLETVRSANNWLQSSLKQLLGDSASKVHYFIKTLPVFLRRPDAAQIISEAREKLLDDIEDLKKKLENQEAQHNRIKRYRWEHALETKEALLATLEKLEEQGTVLEAPSVMGGEEPESSTQPALPELTKTNVIKIKPLRKRIRLELPLFTETIEEETGNEEEEKREQAI